MPRCQHVNRHSGQCPLDALEEDSRCGIHTYADKNAYDRRVYHILKHQYRIRHSELSDHEELKSLREELAIARLILEERFNAIKSEVDLLAACGSLNSLLLTIEKLVTSCHKLEQSVGTLLSKPTLLKIANDIVTILLEELAGVPGYEGIVDQISGKIIETINACSQNCPD